MSRQYTDALERALAVVVARGNADLKLVRDRAEAIMATASAKVAEAETRIVRMEQLIVDRLSSLHDGLDGEDGEPGPQGERGDPGPQGPPGDNGRWGEDGRSLNIRETWSADEAYSALDVVALNGASFVARRDDPGVCPGDGWQLIASQGKRGTPGERGPVGKGERGLPGPTAIALDIDEAGLLTLTNADGSKVSCDLYPLLVRLI